MPKPRLRIQLIGADSDAKLEMAKELRQALSPIVGRVVIVPDLQDAVHERLGSTATDHLFFFSLEDAYLQAEHVGSSRTKHLIFVDSIVDRHCRAMDAGVRLDAFFKPRLAAYAHEEGHNHLFVYARFDRRRDELIFENHLPVHIWSADANDGAEAAAKAACLQIGVFNGHKFRTTT